MRAALVALALWLGAAIACAQAPAPAPAELRVAIVIGNAAYASAPLATPANDARAMAEALRGLGFKVFEARDANKAEMEAVLLRARDAMTGGAAVGMLYYAGHGLQSGWRNYMVPLNATLTGPQDVAANAVEVQRVVDAFKSAGNRMNIFVLDACRENPFGVSASARGLAQMDAPPNSFLAYAAAPGEVADDGDAGNGNGLYARFLLNELKQPGAKIEDVFKRVRFQVRRQSQGRQVPWENTSLETDFFFDPGVATELRADAPTAANPEATGRARAEPAAVDFMAGSTRFSGAFRRDPGKTTYSGTGRVAWANGDVFEGALVAGQREGRGTFVWPSGQRFEGDWRQDRAIGQGTVWFANGDHFEGAVEDGEPNGPGRMRYASGDRYVGQMKAGRPHGRGVYTWINGQSLEGDWVDGEGRGSGTMRFVTGDLYVGAVVDGMPNGRGQVLLTTGDTYLGGVKGGRPDGEGTYTWKNGDRYVGQWKDGVKDGIGVMILRNGDRREGTYRAGAMLPKAD